MANVYSRIKRTGNLNIDLSILLWRDVFVLFYVSYIMYLRYFFHYVFMSVFSRLVKKHILKNFAFVWLSKNGVWKPNVVRFTVIDFCITCCRQIFVEENVHRLLFQWKRKWSQFTKTQRHLKLAFKLLYLFVYNNYKEFEISVLSLSHWKLKGLGQWSLIGVNAIGTGKKFTNSKPYW